MQGRRAAITTSKRTNQVDRRHREVYPTGQHTIKKLINRSRSHPTCKADSYDKRISVCCEYKYSSVVHLFVLLFHGLGCTSSGYGLRASGASAVAKDRPSSSFHHFCRK